MKKTTVVAVMAGTALAGMIAGSSARANQQTLTKNHTGTSVSTMDDTKHDCKGQNACKGQGGCKSDANACKGQNACKGKGGCKTS